MTNTKYNKLYWKRMKEQGKNLEISRRKAPARKKYYDAHKDELKADLIKKRKKLGIHYKRHVLTRVKSRAKSLKVPFDLTIDDIIIPVICPILGLKLKYNEGTGPKDNAPSIDRIIPELGYVKGNVVMISNRANRIKSNASLDDMRKIVKFYEKLRFNAFK